jgi:hypothetical protein
MVHGKAGAVFCGHRGDVAAHPGVRLAAGHYTLVIDADGEATGRPSIEVHLTPD